MPKKVSFFWQKDVNQNKIKTDKKLKVLRQRPNKRPNKILTDPILIKNLYDFKRKKLQNTKEKPKTISKFKKFLTSESIISKYRNSKLRSAKPILQPNSNLNINNKQLLNISRLNSLRGWREKYSRAMAVDFDHMYIDCGDSKISIGRDIEYQHLKELNLLHLDLIQQQAEQLIAKEKIIKSIKEENKNLRARLERIDRRLSLSLQKKTSDLSPISVQTDFENDSFPIPIKSEFISSPKSQKSPTSKICIPIIVNERLQEDENLPSDVSNCKKDSLRKLSPRNATPHFSSTPVQAPVQAALSPQGSRMSPRERRLRKDTALIPLIENSPLPLVSPSSSSLSISGASLNQDIRKSRSPSQKHPLSPSAISPPLKRCRTESDLEENSWVASPAEESGGLTNHSLRSRDKVKDVIEIPTVQTFSSLPPAECLSFSEDVQPSIESSTAKVDQLDKDKATPINVKCDLRRPRGRDVLMTEEAYFLPRMHSPPPDLLLLRQQDETQVEIPQWRTRMLSSLYVMEGTENLEDEIFAKRHARHETDERRRKRWDLQRMREQRQYEKLRERYEGRGGGTSAGEVEGETDHRQTLWPDGTAATAVFISEDLPVCAFGQPIADLEILDFCVPWIGSKTSATCPTSSGLQSASHKRKRRLP